MINESKARQLLLITTNWESVFEAAPRDRLEVDLESVNVNERRLSAELNVCV